MADIEYRDISNPASSPEESASNEAGHIDEKIISGNSKLCKYDICVYKYLYMYVMRYIL